MRRFGADLGSFEDGLYYTAETQFPVQLGAPYAVFGMELYNRSITVLVAVGPDHDLPVWLPLALFEVQDPRVPSHWEFAIRDSLVSVGGEKTPRARWGYPELVHDEDHFVGLLEGTRDATAIFTRARDRTEC